MQGVQHTPQREAPEETLRIIADFTRRVLENEHDARQ
jgi:hypothetical protein